MAASAVSLASGGTPFGDLELEPVAADDRVVAAAVAHDQPRAGAVLDGREHAAVEPPREGLEIGRRARHSSHTITRISRTIPIPAAV